MKNLVLLLLLLAGGPLGAQTNRIGTWKTDRDSLPCFSYTGALPYSQQLANGQPVKLPKDPWFLLGNYRLTVFTHVSGEYELITGEPA